MSQELNLGVIKELSLNHLFKLEDKDFTPWLQENIDFLGQVIGMDIADAETEVKIGNYRLDLLAYESGTDRKIAVENQFGSTDHKHLGQLITYTAGINADVVVWIAESFNNEHITAINYLNEISMEDVAFFGIRPRLIRINDSKPAIEFLVVAKPDEWEKQLIKETKLSEREMDYRKFWIALLEKYKQIYPDYTLLRRVYPTRSYCVMSYAASGIEYTIRFRKGTLFITLYIRYNAKPSPHEIIDEIIGRKSEIEDKLGLKLEIEKKEDIQSTNAGIKYPKEVDILSISEHEKEIMIDWVIKWMPRFKNILNPIIREIQAEED